MSSVFTSIQNLTDAEKLQYGLSERIYSLFEINGGDIKNLYVLEDDIVRPIVYFDGATGFEFRFTVFLDSWEDVSQIQRFGRQLQQHSIKNIN